ncbi:uncharacterized protein DS421_20g687640 [Arachis hypogaea]|nr:uncharacterized protein DS421_20g687640 [Arachis hypogaea]
MLTCDHLVPPDRYNDRVEEHLRLTGFYHVSQIGVVQCQKALVNVLIERWHPDTHTFHLSIGECAVTLEDVALILGLPTDGLLVTGMTMSSFEALEAECLLQFGVAPRKSDCRGSCIKLTYLRDLKENLELTDEISIQRYMRCHIMLLIGTILFGDKSGAGVHWKFLPLLRNFVSIGQYSWGAACLAHLYRALCRASRFNCKEIDGPLTLLLGWAWIRLPYLSPLPKEPRSFPLANRWRNWERGDRRYRYLNLAHFRKAFDELQEGQFVWVAYAVDRVDPNIILAEIYMYSGNSGTYMASNSKTRMNDGSQTAYHLRVHLRVHFRHLDLHLHLDQHIRSCFRTLLHCHYYNLPVEYSDRPQIVQTQHTTR